MIFRGKNFHIAAILPVFPTFVLKHLYYDTFDDGFR